MKMCTYKLTLNEKGNQSVGILVPLVASPSHCVPSTSISRSNVINLVILIASNCNLRLLK